MKEVFLLATGRAEPIPLARLREVFAEEEAEISPLPAGGFSLSADEAKVEVRFESRELPPPFDSELLTGSGEALEALGKAHGFYRISIEPGKPQPTVAVFTALWCARTLLQEEDGIVVDLTAFKVHDAEDVSEIIDLDFDIRDHVSLHAVAVAGGDTPLWVHTHGMEKFGVRDVEIFHLAEADLQAAESFLHELSTELAFGQGPPARALIETSSGDSFSLQPSEEARVSLMGVPLEAFAGHEGLYLTVVSATGRHTLSELLRPYHERFAQEPAERTSELRKQAQALLPAFKARFHRKGLMEPLTFLVRAPFEVHPDSEAVVEHLWMEVLGWGDEHVIGKLVDGATHTTEWRKGAAVEIEPGLVDALAVHREGRPLEEEEMLALLNSERPV